MCPYIYKILNIYYHSPIRIPKSTYCLLLFFPLSLFLYRGRIRLIGGVASGHIATK